MHFIKLLVHTFLKASLLIAILLFGAGAAATEAESSSQFSQQSKPLAFSGSTVRKRFFFSIYKISHYMAWPDKKSDDAGELIDLISAGEFPQRVEIDFLREVSREQVKEALIDGIEQNNPSIDLAGIESDIDRLSKGFDNDITEESSLILSRSDSSKLTVYFDKKKIIETDNRELTDALWSIWFGRNPIVDSEALIANQLR